MEPISLKELLEATQGEILLSNNDDKYIKNIIIDSRKVKENELYIPIIGERFDGHSFLEDAYNNGCRDFLIDQNHSFEKSDANIIKVEDTTKALLDISKYYKLKFKIKYVAVTGSTGKTTTKDMIQAVLNSKYDTLKNEGNLNNKIGVPLTLFNLNKNHEACVIEMGMSYANEIERLANVVEPQISVISNIGYSHIGNLGSKRNIYKAKMEIIDRFNDENTLIVNGDDEYLSELKVQKTSYEILSFGFREDNHLYCKSYENKDDGMKFKVIMNGEGMEFFIKTKGKHNIYNAMSAILVGMKMNLSVEEIQIGFDNYISSDMRLKIEKIKDFKVINDCYNASPDSMIGALQVLKEFEGRKIAVLGDMLEMGEYSSFVHKEIGKHIDAKIDILITVGNDSKLIGESKKSGESKHYHFSNNNEAKIFINELTKKDDVILFKASRGLKLEEIINHLKKLEV
ncbi:UDP-N-acetylmuramoyl-tripeptide--D-alanyl-D-alanine ligase [Peptostreptococcaceae bacterium AGR-M142]